MPTITINYNPELLPWAEGKDIIINVFADRTEVKPEINFDIKKVTGSYKLLSFADEESKRLAKNKQMRTSKAYMTAAKGLIEFAGNENLKISDIDAPLMQRFQMYLISTNRNLNTISFYLRNIRALFKRAVKESLIKNPQENPFQDLATGVYTTNRTSLSKQEIQKLVRVDSKQKTLKKREVDSLKYFLFSFYAKGMSFIDLVFLKKENIYENELSYKRKQNDRYLTVKLTPAMTAIINYFAPRVKDSPYLFPILDPEGEEYMQYNAALCTQNRLLKRIAAKSKINKDFSTNMARNSWIAMSEEKNGPAPLVDKDLKDTDEATTIDSNISEKISGLVQNIVTTHVKKKKKE